jgi:hypothetical protein
MAAALARIDRRIKVAKGDSRTLQQIQHDLALIQNS